jgi:hypothetical protein
MRWWGTDSLLAHSLCLATLSLPLPLLQLVLDDMAQKDEYDFVVLQVRAPRLRQTVSYHLLTPACLLLAEGVSEQRVSAPWLR